MTKYNRTNHLPFSLGISNDDKVSNDVSSLLGIEVVITEKLDGENCGMTNSGVYARSHAVYTDSPWSKEVRKIHSLKVRDQLNESEFIFGENMEGVHSIEYNKLSSYFYMFGIRDGLTWLSWETVELYASLLDIPTVPVLFKGIINTENELRELISNLVSEKSMLGDTIEGVVIRNANAFSDVDFKSNVMKWVRKGHVQTDSHWTKNWKKAKLNIDRFE